MTILRREKSKKEHQLKADLIKDMSPIEPNEGRK